MATPAPNDPFLKTYGFMNDFRPLLTMVGVPDSDLAGIAENVMVESGGDPTKNETLIIRIKDTDDRADLVARGLNIGKPERIKYDINRKATPEEEQVYYSKKYANVNGNGDEQSGDGYKYRGRGLFQVTGKNNYSRLQELTNLPLLEKPELAADPDVGPFVQAMFLQMMKNEGKYKAGGNDFAKIGRVLNFRENSDERRKKFTVKNYPAFDFSRRNEFKSRLDSSIVGYLHSGMMDGVLYQRALKLKPDSPNASQEREEFFKALNELQLQRATKNAIKNGTKPQSR